MAIIYVLDDFLGMADVHLYLLSKTEKCPFHQIFEEGQVLENLLVRFLQKLRF